MAVEVRKLLKAARAQIVDLLKTRGPMSADELAAELKLSDVSIRRHLETLQEAGVVKFDIERHDRGRPTYKYSLTANADRLFPTNYRGMALEILVQVRSAFGDEGLKRVFTGCMSEMFLDLAPRLKGLPFDEMMEEFSRALNERGFLTKIEKQEDGSYKLSQFNCPTLEIAREFPQVCEEELRVYRQLLDCDVLCETSLAGGERASVYRILPKDIHHGDTEAQRKEL